MKYLHPCQEGHENSCPLAGIEKSNPVCEKECNVPQAWMNYTEGKTKTFDTKPPERIYGELPNGIKKTKYHLVAVKMGYLSEKEMFKKLSQKNSLKTIARLLGINDERVIKNRMHQCGVI